jgi:P2-related tail formation protein
MERLQRDKDSVDKGIGAVSIAATSILSAANAAGALKYVAASLGLTTSLNDTLFERFLFGQDVSLVQQKVDQLMTAYEKTIDSQLLSSRSDVVTVIRNDLQYCTPAVIQANITAAIQGATVTVQTAAGAPVNTPGVAALPGAVSPTTAGLNAKATLMPGN